MSQDRDLDKYLDGKTDLSKLYAEMPEVELPKHLDAAILAEAHRAVNARPGSKPKRRWTIPLGMVATLFVAVMIGLQLPYMLKETDQAQQVKEERMAALMDTSSTESPATAPDERKNIQVRDQLMSKSKAASTPDKPAPIAAEAKVVAKPSTPAFATPKESSTISGAAYTTVAPATKIVPESIVTPQPSPVARSLGAASIVESPSVIAPSQAPVRAAKRLESKERADFYSGAALSKAQKNSGHAEGNISETLEQRESAAAKMVAPQPAKFERSLKESDNEASLPPKDWLNRINKLKHEGKLEEAKKDLAAFKKQYPDYPVPEALEVR